MEVKIEQPKYDGNIIRMLYDDTNMTESNFKNIASLLKIVAGVNVNSVSSAGKDSIIFTGFNIEDTENSSFRISSGVIVSDRLKYPIVYTTDNAQYLYSATENNFYLKLDIILEKPLMRRQVNPSDITKISSVNKDSMQYLSSSIIQIGNDELDEDNTIKLGSIIDNKFVFDEKIVLLWDLNKITDDLNNSTLATINNDTEAYKLNNVLARRNSLGQLQCNSTNKNLLEANYNVVNERRLHQVLSALVSQVNDKMGLSGDNKIDINNWN